MGRDPRVLRALIAASLLLQGLAAPAIASQFEPITPDGPAIDLSVDAAQGIAQAPFVCVAGTRYGARITTSVPHASRIGTGRTQAAFSRGWAEFVSPISGECRITFDPTRDNVGPATVQLWSVPSDGDASVDLPSFGPTINLKVAKPVQWATAGFMCQKDTRYGVRFLSAMAGGTYDAYLSIPGGKKIRLARNWLEWTATSDGMCRFVFDPKEERTETSESNRLTVYAARVIDDWVVSAPLGDTETALKVERPMQRGVAEFPCEAGRRYGVLLSPSSAFHSSFQEIPGTRAATLIRYGSYWWKEFVPVASGTCRTVFDPNYENVGTASVRIWSALPAEDEVVSRTPTGTAALVRVTKPLQNSIVTFPCAANVRYGARVDSGLSRTMRFIKPSGAVGSSFGGTSSTWVAPESGTCGIRFDPEGPVVGSGMVQLWTAAAGAGCGAANGQFTYRDRKFSDIDGTADETVTVHATGCWDGTKSWGTSVATSLTANHIFLGSTVPKRLEWFESMGSGNTFFTARPVYKLAAGFVMLTYPSLLLGPTGTWTPYDNRALVCQDPDYSTSEGWATLSLLGEDTSLKQVAWYKQAPVPYNGSGKMRMNLFYTPVVLIDTPRPDEVVCSQRATDFDPVLLSKRLKPYRYR